MSRAKGHGPLDGRVAEILDDFSALDVTAPWLMCDRHPTERTAFRFFRDDLSEEVLTYGELRSRSHRAAATLVRAGVGPGDRVASLLGKGADLPALLLGIWRLGAVYVPLFTAFAATTVEERVVDCGARVIVTDASQLPKTTGLTCAVMMANVARGQDVPAGITNLTAALLDDAHDGDEVETDRATQGATAPIVHMFTSGTTGKPKAVVHPLRYLAGWQSYLEVALAPGESYWCAADPGWAYGLYTAVLAPMAAGIPSIMACGAFRPDLTWTLLQSAAVTDFAGAPTMYRALRVADPGIDLPHLRHLSSAGEPLTPDVGAWTRSRFGIDVHDHFGQTELGMPAGFPHHPAVRIPPVPGSMGRSLPGWTLAVLRADADEAAGTDEVGRLAVAVHSSDFFTFTGYGPDRDMRADRFTDDGAYYLTGDLASIDDDGLIHFSSREDDVILMAGYRIGPFDIESVLLTHPAVVEVAVVAAPDEVRGEVIHAFVVPNPTQALNDGQQAAVLTEQLQTWVKDKYGAHAYPRGVTFVEALPKTPSGKVQRVALRRQLAQEAPA